MKRISRSTTDFYLRDPDTGYIARYSIEPTRKGKLLTTTATVYRRDDLTLLPVCTFRYETSLRIADALKQRFRRSVPSLPYMTDADLIGEVKKRNLYQLSNVPDDLILVEALNRGIVPAGTVSASEPDIPDAPDDTIIMPQYDDASQTDAIFAPGTKTPTKRGLLKRLFRRG